MPTMEKKRLLKLADLLEADAKNKKGMKFDLAVVAQPSPESRDDFGDWQPTLECGTVGCAVGLACVSGAFNRAGLGYRLRWSDITPTYRGHEGWHVVDDFFGIARPESDFLFMGDSYPKKQRKGRKGELAVAKRIRKFVADRTIATKE